MSVFERIVDYLGRLLPKRDELVPVREFFESRGYPVRYVERDPVTGHPLAYGPTIFVGTSPDPSYSLVLRRTYGNTMYSPEDWPKMSSDARVYPHAVFAVREGRAYMPRSQAELGLQLLESLLREYEASKGGVRP